MALLRSRWYFLKKVLPDRHPYLLAHPLKMLDFYKVILTLGRWSAFPVVYIMIDFVIHRYFEKWNDQTKAVHIYSFISSKRFAPCPELTETFDIESLTDKPLSRYSLYFAVAYAFRQV